MQAPKASVGARQHTEKRSGTPSRNRDLRRILERELPWILRTSSRVAHRCGLGDNDAVDFESWVILRLMVRDFALMKSCKNPRRLRGYLRSVIRNLSRDYRNHLWGKWRPSSRARRHGARAVELEKLRWRDGLSLSEAIEVMRSNRGCAETAEDLERLASDLPPQNRRLFVGLDTLEVGSGHLAEPRPLQRERDASFERILSSLTEALEELAPEDRQIIQRHFYQDESIASIARDLEIDQRSLYSRRDRVLKHLLHLLREQGVGWEDIDILISKGVGAAIAHSESSVLGRKRGTDFRLVKAQ